MKPPKRYTVHLHGSAKTTQIYRGNSTSVMYSHVTAVETTLKETHGTAEIEIVENGESRWVQYRDGVLIMRGMK